MIATLFSSGRNILIAGAVLLGLFMVFGNSGPSGPQTVDMGQVLDRTDLAMTNYDDFARQNGISDMNDAQYAQFSEYLALTLNADPRFYDQTMGIELQPDASFVGFADTNADMIRDADEAKLFTLELDSANNRLIATDENGAGTHHGFSGTGLLAGMLIGNMLSRQGAAGVRPGAFNNRQTTARSAYKAPASSRPASARSRSRSGGFSVGK